PGSKNKVEEVGVIDEFGSTPFTEVPTDITADLPEEEASHNPFDSAPFSAQVVVESKEDTDLFGSAPFVPEAEAADATDGKLQRKSAVRYQHASKVPNMSVARGLREQKETNRRNRQRRISRSSSNSSSGGGKSRRSKVKDVNKKNVDQPQNPQPTKESESTDLFGFSPFKPGSRSDCEVPVQ
uniref:Uncharacterized protein n=1 Tax=Ciona intestinalis TaxID=7719 RepID=F6XFN8_CIOIN